MKIGVFLVEHKPVLGGGFTFQEILLEALLAATTNHEFFIFYYGLGFEVKKQYQNIKFIQLTGSKIGIHLKEKLAKTLSLSSVERFYLDQAVRKYAIDLVWFIGTGFEKVDVPYIYTVLDLQHRLQPFFPEVSIGRNGQEWESRETHYSGILKRATFIICGTQEGKREVIQFYGVDESRIKILPHPTPNLVLGNIKAEGGKIKDLPRNYLFYPAQFWPHKNHIVILEALKILNRKKIHDFSAVFTGVDKGNLGYIEEKVKELGLTGKVLFLGFVSNEEIIYLYKHAFTLVYPTFFGPENFPPLEAFALGCPVIASSVAGSQEQLGDAAILFDPTDENKLVSAVEKLWKSKSLREILIKKGFERAKRWTAKDFVQGIISIIDEFEKYRRTWGNAPYKHLD